MKKTILLLIAFIPLVCYSQKEKKIVHQVKTVDGFIYSGEIERFLKNKIYFHYVTPELENNSLPIEIVSIVIGQNPSFRKKAMLKANPKIQFKMGIQQSVSSFKYENKSSGNGATTGDYLIKAGNRYLTGISLGVAGSVVTYLGVEKGDDEMAVIGGVIAISGAIVSLTGHFQLIEAGKMFNEAVSISAADTGIGLAINF